MSIFNDANKQLDAAIAKRKAQSFENDRGILLKSVGNDMAKMLEPVLERTMQKVISNQAIHVAAPVVNVPAPQVTVTTPTVNVPEPKVTVNVPPTIIPEFPKIPKLEWPKDKMPIDGWVRLMGVDLENPLPVQLRDASGAPLKLFDNLTQIVNASQAGGFKRVTIDKILGSDGTPYSSTNPIPVTITSGGTATTGSNIVDSSGVAYSGSNPIPVTITSGATATSGAAIVDSSGIQYSGSNPLPVVITSGATATTAVYNLNAEGLYRDTFPVQGTVTVSSVTASTGATILNGDGVARDTWGMKLVTDATATVNVVNVDSAGAYRSTFPVSGTVLVSDVTASVKSALVDSTGVQYSGSNPVPMKIGDGTNYLTVATTASDNESNTSNKIRVESYNDIYDPVAGTWNRVRAGSGYTGPGVMRVVHATDVGVSISSTVVWGPAATGVADDGTNPLKTGGVARTANPSAVGTGTMVASTYDDLGRQVMRPVQVRDAIATAYVSLATGSAFGTETTLLAATAGSFYDLIYAMGTNDSDYAVKVDFRGVTAGNVLFSIMIPGGGTAGVATPVPIPQSGADSGNAWTIDAPDISGTNVTVSALFTKEV